MGTGDGVGEFNSLITPQLKKDMLTVDNEMVNTKPRVFVTNFAGHDYSKAEKFGEIVWITRGYISFHSLDRVKYRICEEVNKSTSEDYLLLSGVPVICVVAALFWQWKHQKVKLLVHDKKGDGEYRELIITDKNWGDLLSVLNHGS